MRIKTCLHKIVIPKDSSWGLKHSGVGNCKECNIVNDESCKCKIYYEATIDLDTQPDNQ
jgi:hypothetical protein